MLHARQDICLFVAMAACKHRPQESRVAIARQFYLPLTVKQMVRYVLYGRPDVMAVIPKRSREAPNLDMRACRQSDVDCVGRPCKLESWASLEGFETLSENQRQPQNRGAVGDR